MTMLSLLLGSGLELVVAPSAGASTHSVLCSGYASCSRGAFTTNGYQNHANRSYWTMYPGDNCTNYVAYVESAIFGVPTPKFNLGDGGAWGSAAARNGVLVDHVPTVGSVAVWVGGSPGIPWPGHVAVVEFVGPGARYIEISQQHISADVNGFDWTRIDRNAANNEWQDWPTSFVHFKGGPGSLVDGIHLGLRTTPTNALQSHAGRLATINGRVARIWRVGIQQGTSPSVTAVPHGFEIAFQSSRRLLETAGVEGNRSFHVTLRKGTGPSITAVARGYEVALQSATGRLVTIGAAGTRTWSIRVRTGTSPSITPLFGGGYEVAVQSSSGSLVTVGTGGLRRWRLGMRASTNPSITAVYGGGFEVAIQDNRGRLVTVGSAGPRHWGLRMRHGTSPSIAPIFGGGYEVAVQTVSRSLWAVGGLGTRAWHIAVRSGTSPSIAATHGGGYEIAFQSSMGRLIVVGSKRARAWPVQMQAGTSPSIRP